MASRFNLTGVPDDLPPGTYGTVLKKARWEGPDVVFDIEFDPADPHREGLFQFTKEDGSQEDGDR